MSFLQKLDRTSEQEKWRLVRQWMIECPLELYAELREHRPVLVLPEVTVVTRFADCSHVLLQHEAFSVRLYKPKQGSYWMSQDDTARHWREKSIMRSILDLEDISDIGRYAAAKTSEILSSARAAST